MESEFDKPSAPPTAERDRTCILGCAVGYKTTTKVGRASLV